MIKSILLIDDSEPDNFLHSYLLKKVKEFENIDSVLNVEEAIKFLDDLSAKKEEMPAIILVDINMPRLNGWDFLDLVKEKEYSIENTRFYMLTTSLNPDDKEKALNEYKLNGFFHKPLTYEHIEVMLEMSI
ncbi:MAG: response regulator [Bacteroidetes bacterium]|nr:response regulator [Bacteroidota bacterium]